MAQAFVTFHSIWSFYFFNHFWFKDRLLFKYQGGGGGRGGGAAKK